MEILNNIWTALSMPNESLTNALMSFLGIFESALSMYLFLVFLNLHPTKKQKISFRK